MKDMKFRIWNKNSKSFVLNSENKIAMFDLVTWAYFAATNKMERLDSYIVNQYTNLLDKTNEDIYEGDICKAYKSNSYLKGNYEVIWDEKHGKWAYK